MSEKQKEISSENEEFQKKTGSVSKQNAVEVASLKQLLAKGKISKNSQLKREANIGKNSNAVTLSVNGSTEVTTGTGRDSITSQTFGPTVQRGEKLSGSVGLTSITGENGQGNIENQERLLGASLKVKF